MSAPHVEPAYAKINLILRILEREQSGYHGIETLFQRLALHDLVRVTALPNTRALHCDGPTMPAAGLGAPEANLAWRAAQAFVDATRWDTGWHIEITKQIPVGGGLGGGSADAAAVLRALNALCPAPLPLSALCEIGGALGADVPFLVADVSRAWAWGRGDRFVVLPPLPARPVRLFSFPEGVNTAAAYGAFAAARASTVTAGRATQAHVYTQDTFASWERIADVAANDFETVVSTMHAGVAAALPQLHALAARATSRGTLGIGMMSGSGATCLYLANELHDDDTLTGPHVIDTTTL